MGKIKSNKDLTIIFNGDCIVHNIGIEASQKVALRSDKGDVLIGHHAFQATYGNARLMSLSGIRNPSPSGEGKI